MVRLSIFSYYKKYAKYKNTQSWKKIYKVRGWKFRIINIFSVKSKYQLQKTSIEKKSGYIQVHANDLAIKNTNTNTYQIYKKNPGNHKHGYIRDF